MSWDSKFISPKRSAQARARDISPSPPVMRFLGAVGFSTFGIGTLTLGMRVLGIDQLVWYESNWSGKFVLLFISSLIASLVGGVLGLGLGITIKVRSERLDYVLSVLWHYLANGNIIWCLLFSLAMAKIYDKEELRRFVVEFGSWRMSFWTLGICSISCLLIGAVLLLAGLLKEGSKPRMAPCLALSLPIALAVSYFQFAVLRIASRDWIVIGLLLPFVLILVSTHTINRDREQRSQIIKR